MTEPYQVPEPRQLKIRRPRVDMKTDKQKREAMTQEERDLIFLQNISTEVSRACDAFFERRNMPLKEHPWKGGFKQSFESNLDRT